MWNTPAVWQEGSVPNAAGAVATFIGQESVVYTISLSNEQFTLGEINFLGGVAGGYALIKEGLGTVFLRGANSYTSGTHVENGILKAGIAGTFVDNNTYTVNGGTLDLNGFDLTMSSLSGNGGTIALGSANLTADQATDTTFAGSIQGAGGVIKSGNGSLSLNGNNSYGGLTLVNSGTLMIGSSAGENAATLQGDVRVANGGALGGFGSINGNVGIQSKGKLAPGKPEGTSVVELVCGRKPMQIGPMHKVL